MEDVSLKIGNHCDEVEETTQKLSKEDRLQKNIAAKIEKLSARLADIPEEKKQHRAKIEQTLAGLQCRLEGNHCDEVEETTQKLSKEDRLQKNIAAKIEKLSARLADIPKEKKQHRAK